MLTSVLQMEPLPTWLLSEVVKVSAGAAVGILGYWLKQRYERQRLNAEDLNELQSVVFGLDGVEGVVEVLESHDESIERVNDRLDELREDIDSNSDRVDNIEARLGQLLERCRERGKDGK